MVEIIFTESSVAIYSEGKLVSLSSRHSRVYFDILNILTDGPDTDYKVFEGEKEIFHGTTWREADSFVAKYLDY